MKILTHLSFLAVALLLGCLANQVSTVEGGDILYGDEIVFQNNVQDKRYLTGARNVDDFWDDNSGVYTKGSRFDEDEAEAGVPNSYVWFAQGSRDARGYPATPDPKAGQCVKYGDRIFLRSKQEHESKQFWLGQNKGADLDDEEVAGTRALNPSDGLMTWKYQFIVGSVPGLGDHYNGRGSVDNPNPNPSVSDNAWGICVQENAIIYLQALGSLNRWLCGNQLGLESHPAFIGLVLSTVFDWVYTADFWDDWVSKYRTGLFLFESYQGDEVITNPSEYAASFQWIVRRGIGTGTRSGVLQCAAVAAEGVWTPLAYTNGGQSFEYEEGISRSDSVSEENKSAWDVSVTASVTASAKFLGSGVEAKLEVSGAYGQEQTRTVASALEKTTTVSQTVSFEEGGQVWQFQYIVQDICVTQWTLKTKDLVSTGFRSEPPCCLPGLARDIDQQHGPCVAGPCNCSDEICDEEVVGPTSAPNEVLVQTEGDGISTPEVNLNSSGFKASISLGGVVIIAVFWAM